MPPRPKVLDFDGMLNLLGDELSRGSKTIEFYEPHEKQSAFHKSEKHEKLFIGGNRSGKTVGSVCEATWRLTKTHPFRKELNEIEEEIRGRWVAVSFKEGVEEIAIPLFKRFMPTKFLINRKWEDSYNSYTKVLTLNNGSFLEFKSYEQDLEKFAGTSRHFVAFDEEPPMSIWQECKLRLLDTEGDWWISMTPVEGMTWIYHEIYDKWKKGNRPYTLVIEVNTNENPHLSQVGKDIAFGDLSDEDRATREQGGFNEYTGRVYKDFDRNVHVIPRTIPDKASGAELFTSLDTGYRHPAVWLWHAIYPNGRIITFHEISLAEKTVNELAAMVHEFEKKELEPRGFTQWDIRRSGDPNGLPQTKEHTGTSVQQEYALNGIYIGTEGMTREVDIGIIRITQYMKARIKVINHGSVEKVSKWAVTEDCPKLIKGIENYQWDRHASKKMEYEKAKKPTPLKKDDDEVDSLRYFFVLMPELTTAHIPEAKQNVPSQVPGYSASQYSSYTAPKVYESSGYNYGMEG